MVIVFITLIMDIAAVMAVSNILTNTSCIYGKLFVQEVPEIYEGIIKIKSVVVPLGYAKIAVKLTIHLLMRLE